MTPYLHSQNVQICILVSIILQWWFFDWGGGGATAPLAPPASYGHDPYHDADVFLLLPQVTPQISNYTYGYPDYYANYSMVCKLLSFCIWVESQEIPGSQMNIHIAKYLLKITKT